MGAIDDFLYESPPRLPREIEDKKLTQAHKKFAADLFAFQGKLKVLEKDRKALEKSMEKLGDAFLEAKEAKHGRDSSKIKYSFEGDLSRLGRGLDGLS